MAEVNIGLVIGQLTAGGAEGQLLHVARALKGTGYTPFVYCLSSATKPVGPQVEAAGVPLRVIAGGKSMRPYQLARRLAADRVALLHSWLYIGNTYAWLANRLGKRRPLITAARNCKRQGLVHDITNRLAFRESRRVIANSREVARYVRRTYGAAAARITVLYNGVDVERFRPPANNGNRDALIVGIGRLVSQKDPELFLEAASGIARLYPEARFCFVGEGPLRPRLETATAARHLDGRLQFPGETRDIPAILRAAKLFWLTSAWEGLPNVVLEAMACGVPVVATDVGGTRELVRSGREGFLVQPGDAEGLVHYANWLLAQPEQWRCFSQRARAQALRFSVAAMTKAMINLYDEVWTESQPGEIT